MAYWACVQTEPQREWVAQHFLELSEFEVYFPRVLECRIVRTRRTDMVRPLFPCYLFARIELQWSRARWSIGVTRLILDGERPAIVPDAIIDALRRRERGGCVQLPKRPRWRPGDRVKITTGPFQGHLAIYQGMPARERVLVLLALFGSLQKVEISQNAIENS